MSSLFRPAFDLLAQYAAYHRDRRNITTHLFGVPMIVFGLLVLLSTPSFAVAGTTLTPAWLVFALAGVWYLTRGEFALGLATCAGVAVLTALAHQAGSGSTSQWLGWGLGFFIVGWAIQFVGHYYEGRKPAFVDDLVGLLVAPLFVTLELLALAGLFRGLVGRIEGRVGPTVIRDLAHPAT